MHRSGTSCLTGIMQGLGVELGEVYTHNKFNQKGNRENDAIVTLNENLLIANGGSWYEPVVVESWAEDHAQERDEIIADLSNRDAEFWGFKDTRTLFTLPFWLEGIAKPRFIGTFRHPHRVALSLHQRDNTDIPWSWQLWRTYNLRLLEVAEDYGCELIDFDLDDARYLDSVIQQLELIGLDPALAKRGREFFDPALRNQANARVDSVNLPRDVLDVYDRLQTHAARGQH